METNLILASAFAGCLLAIIEGIKPGPLLTMVIRAVSYTHLTLPTILLV